ncbi:hypothetical protein ACFL6Y_08260 [Elusimicrobiota bacterium]
MNKQEENTESVPGDCSGNLAKTGRALKQLAILSAIHIKDGASFVTKKGGSGLIEAAKHASTGTVIVAKAANKAAKAVAQKGIPGMAQAVIFAASKGGRGAQEAFKAARSAAAQGGDGVARAARFAASAASKSGKGVADAAGVVRSAASKKGRDTAGSARSEKVSGITMRMRCAAGKGKDFFRAVSGAISSAVAAHGETDVRKLIKKRKTLSNIFVKVSAPVSESGELTSQQMIGELGKTIDIATDQDDADNLLILNFDAYFKAIQDKK